MSDNCQTDSTISPFRLNCRMQLRNLLDQALNLVATGGLKVLPTQELPFDFTYLSYRLGPSLAQQYRTAENQMRLELAPHRVSHEDVVLALWKLFFEVTTNVEKYIQKGRIIRRVREFEEWLDVELVTFDVAYSIEYLNLGSQQVKVGNVTFLTPENNTLMAWGFNEEWWQQDAARVGSMSLALIEVTAADGSRAQETGLTSVLESLHMLRVAALIGRESNLPLDELMQWKLGSRWVSKAKDAGATKRISGAHRRFRPLVTDLSNAINAGFETHNLANLVDGELPFDIQQRLLRAIHWISHSAAHESDDYKIVDLCTALETMLLPSYNRGSKGQLIALRYNLLGGDMNPPAVRWFYEIRSAIVHGSALQVTSPSDTWHLRLICFTVLEILIRRAQRHPQATTLENLVASIETSDSLTTFVDRCERGIYQGSGVKDLKNFARSRLKELTSKA